MEKKKKIIGIAGVFALLILNILILCHREPIGGNYELRMSVTADRAQQIQVYYSPSRELAEENSSVVAYENAGAQQEMSFAVPSACNWIRLDLGQEPGEFEITNLSLEYKDAKIGFGDLSDIEMFETQQIVSSTAVENGVSLVTDGTDPYIWFPMETESLYAALTKDIQLKNWILNALMLLFVDGAAAGIVIFRKKVLVLPLELWQNRALILNLAKNDFKTKYAGSYLGIFWAFVQPIVTILVYWFVFSVGLKSGNVQNYPFVLYLVSGIVPWFFFQDALNSGTNALIEYNYLVKKVVFKISILPIVKIVSALFVHAFFVVFSLVLCWLYGYAPGLHTVQIIYYSVCTFLFSLGLVYATSAIVIFFRDLTQIIGIVLQVGVWMTPIMWDLNMLSNHPLVMKLFKFNPMYYIVSGYRDAMLGKVWFWERWGWTLYFWVITVVLFALGSVIFKRLKPHFADVL